MIFACKDCPERKVGCHASCPKYREDKERREAERKEIKKDWQIDCYEASMRHKRIKINRTLKIGGKE